MELPKATSGRDVVMITLDTLRYDAAQAAFSADRLTTLGPRLGPKGWERRHTPATFTYAAHHAFFSGFLPTPAKPGPHPRLFAAEFAGSESSTDDTFTFPEATIPEAMSALGYRTICIGGTGFFNQQNALGSVLPDLFDEAHWDPSLGVTERESPQNQIGLAVERLNADKTPAFLFINASAIHQPNWFYGEPGMGFAGSAEETDGTEVAKEATAEVVPYEDSLVTHTAALVAFDAALPPLFDCLSERGGAFCIVCSDHGTAYGEDGYTGHRCAHPVVWDVPYAEFVV